MKRITMLAFLFAILYSPLANACNARPFGQNFLDDLRINFMVRSDFVQLFTLTEGNVIGTIGDYGAVFQVHRTFFGPAVKDTIVIWGDPGTECRRGLQGLSPDDTVFALVTKYGYQLVGPLEKPEDFIVHSGTFGVALVNNDSVFVNGYAFQNYYLSYQAFLDSIAIISQVPPHLTVPSEALGNAALKIFPNPTAGKCTVQYPSSLFHSERVSILVSDVLGQEFFNKNVKGVSAHQFEIDVSSLPAGCYIITVNSDRKRFTQKLMKL